MIANSVGASVPRLHSQPGSLKKIVHGGAWLLLGLASLGGYAFVGDTLHHSYPPVSGRLEAVLLILSAAPIVICIGMVVRSFVVGHQLAKDHLRVKLAALPTDTLTSLWAGGFNGVQGSAVELCDDERIVLASVLDERMPEGWRKP